MQNSVMTPTPSSLTPTLRRVTRHTTLCASVVAMLALSACQAPARKTEAVVAYPQIPTTQPYEIYDSETVSRADEPSVAAQRWQDFYSDARLRRLIELALDNNKDINAAVLVIQKSRAQYQITDINDLPTFNGSASAARTGDFNGTATTRYNVGLALASYEFDFWGRIASLKEAALQDFLATAAAKDAVQISLISNIAQSYVVL
ncbi:TolC family protein [Faucicola atlantae]|uniref:TolC family protein n=1 Tax=Faucicola atlantae TaxID=34059 RepID=UPI0025B1DF68|nr:TolC family protein [Moraxella atlantae]